TVDLTAVDQNRNCARFITATSDALDAGIHVVQADAMQYVRRASTSFDLIFADPPYDWEHHESLVKSILDIGLLSKGGEAVIEHSNQTDLSNLPGFFAHRKYGHVNFSFFSRPQDVAAED
ncbi:RsmD family RNA methyltransferase, partial [Schleiferiaceae bacterium]|nr:RsmD family RNA methyltransferase [Schleiferiaceae bacterium]